MESLECTQVNIYIEKHGRALRWHYLDPFEVRLGLADMGGIGSVYWQVSAVEKRQE